jgi:hypothetical protein
LCHHRSCHLRCHDGDSCNRQATSTCTLPSLRSSSRKQTHRLSARPGPSGGDEALKGSCNAVQLGPPGQRPRHPLQRALRVGGGGSKQLAAGAAVPKGVERAQGRGATHCFVVLVRRDDSDGVLGLRRGAGCGENGGGRERGDSDAGGVGRYGNRDRNRDNTAHGIEEKALDTCLHSPNRRAKSCLTFELQTLISHLTLTHFLLESGCSLLREEPVLDAKAQRTRNERGKAKGCGGEVNEKKGRRRGGCEVGEVRPLAVG